MVRIPIEWFEVGFESFESLTNGSNLVSKAWNLFRIIRIYIRMLRIPFKWFEFTFKCFKCLSNGSNVHSSASNPFRMVVTWFRKFWIFFELFEFTFECFESLSIGSNFNLNASNLFRIVRIWIRMLRIPIGSFHVKSTQKKSLPPPIWTKIDSCTVLVQTLIHSVVPQAAEFTYILFTQETSTMVTSCQHGLSDLNKRYFQLDISWEPCGLQRSGLCWEVAESIVFRTNFVRNIQYEALGFNNGKYQTPPKCEAAIWLQKLLQTPSSQQVWTVCAHICLVDGWKASQVWFGLCL